MLLLVFLSLLMEYPSVSGKCAEIGDTCDHSEWMKVIKPIQDAQRDQDLDLIGDLLLRLHDNLKNITEYDSRICYVLYDENRREVYNHGYDCGSNNKCTCGIQMMGDPTNMYELSWDNVAKGCRRKTGQVCSQYGFVPEHQSCLSEDVCHDGVCTRANQIKNEKRKPKVFPKFGTPCNFSAWNDLYKPFIDAQAEADSVEGLDAEEFERASEKATKLNSKLINAVSEMNTVCYTASNLLKCGEDNLCSCRKPFVLDKKIMKCRTSTGDTCFLRCTNLYEDQCLSTDNCIVRDAAKGEGVCTPISKGKAKGRTNAGNRRVDCNLTHVYVVVTHILGVLLHISLLLMFKPN